VTTPDGPLGELEARIKTAAMAVSEARSHAPDQLRMERSRHQDQGDFSTNAAMLLAPALKASPREVAERIGQELGQLLGDDLDRLDVAGPGFLNLFLSDRWYRRSLAAMLTAGGRFGAGGAEPAERVLIEFV